MLLILSRAALYFSVFVLFLFSACLNVIFQSSFKISPVKLSQPSPLNLRLFSNLASIRFAHLNRVCPVEAWNREEEALCLAVFSVVPNSYQCLPLATGTKLRHIYANELVCFFSATSFASHNQMTIPGIIYIPHSI